ncbi:MAG: hypothetical protein U0517_00750 [Candidatus Andersenbacteria bacterium]
MIKGSLPKATVWVWLEYILLGTAALSALVVTFRPLTLTIGCPQPLVSWPPSVTFLFLTWPSFVTISILRHGLQRPTFVVSLIVGTALVAILFVLWFSQVLGSQSIDLSGDRLYTATLENNVTETASTTVRFFQTIEPAPRETAPGVIGGSVNGISAPTQGAGGGGVRGSIAQFDCQL